MDLVTYLWQLVGLRTLSDRTTDLVEEPVATAFERPREDRRPLMLQWHRRSVH